MSNRKLSARRVAQQYRLAAMLFSVLLLMIATVHAQEIPGRINYEGRLTNASGVSITNAAVTVNFALYDAVAAGTKVWPAAGTESHTVNVQNGLFNVLIGSKEAVPTAALTDSLFLEIQVNDGSGLETLSPRQPLVAVPYALRASIAEAVGNGVAADLTMKRNGVTVITLTATGVTITGNLGATNIGTSGANTILQLDGTGRLPAVDGSQLTGVGGGNTLDAAYDQGDAGAGRTVTADAGAVQVAGVDGLVSTGTKAAGVIPATGAGVRMMWYPNKAAFRAGEVGGTQWDDANIGNNSTVSGGLNNTASTVYAAISGGNSNDAIGNSSAVGGGENNIAIGILSVVSGGSSNTANGANST